jgi:hypothetical protein
MSAFQPLEKSLDNLFVKNAPVLPASVKKMLVEWLPWINLVFGVLTLWSAYWIWHWAHTANSLVDYANQLSAAYGGPKVASDRLSVMVWFALIVMVVEALLFIAAFPATRDRKKSGWDLMFYAMLVNIAYAVVVLFTDYGGVGSFIWSLVLSAAGLYLLFQIRASYAKGKVPATVKK